MPARVSYADPERKAVVFTTNEITRQWMTRGSMTLVGLGMLFLFLAAFQYRAHEILMTIGASLAGLGLLLLVLAWLQSHSQMPYASLMTGGAALIGLGLVLLEVGRIQRLTGLQRFIEENVKEDDDDSPPRSSPK
jgi:hypothetical protein